MFPAAHGSLPVVVVMLVAGEFLDCVGVIWLDVAAASIFAQRSPATCGRGSPAPTAR